MKSHLGQCVGILGIAAIAAVVSSMSGSAAWAAEVSHIHHKPSRVSVVNRRLLNQRRAILKGLRNGSLTKEQAEKLLAKNEAIRDQEIADKAVHDGHLDKSEFASLEKELNEQRSDIGKEEHSWRAEIQRRLKEQHERIEAGLKNGSLTPEEAKILQEQDHDIRQQLMADLKEGGHLTEAEYKDINRELNEQSQDIYKEKHDGDVKPPVAAGN